MTPAKYQPAPPSHRPREAWITVPEAATHLRVSRMTVYRLVSAGAVPAHRIGRSIRIRERDLDAYLRSTDTTRWVNEE